MYFSFIIFPAWVSACLCNAFKVKAFEEEVTQVKLSRTRTTTVRQGALSLCHGQLRHHVQPP